MNILQRIAITWKPVTRAVLIYAAGAWALIEVVDFAVMKYGLSRWLLDTSVIVAFGGGMITAVLAWFHGEPGQQRVTRPELAIVSMLILATGSSVFYLGTQGPTAEFDQLDGYRVSFEFRQNKFVKDGDEQRSFTVGQMAGLEIIEEGYFYGLEVAVADIKGPSIDVATRKLPMMFRFLDDEEWVTITLVLPYEPKELATLRGLGITHNRLEIDQLNLTVDIREQFELHESSNGVIIRFDD